VESAHVGEPWFVTDSERLTLTDGVVLLRQWRVTDAPAVFAACQDPLIARFTTIPQPYTEGHATSFVEGRIAEWDEQDGKRSFAVVDPHDDALLGTVARFAPDGDGVEFGYWVAPDARRRGVASRALRLIVVWTLETRNVDRLYLTTATDNDVSGRVAEAAGFTKAGIQRGARTDRGGAPADLILYVRLAGRDML
jgi:RimJ/RimL family protein N-acetyltransferase